MEARSPPDAGLRRPPPPQADAITRKIELEKRRVAELDRSIAGMQLKLEEQRRRMGGVNAAKDNNAQVQKHIKILENRLDKALQRYNEAVATNRALRCAARRLSRSPPTAPLTAAMLRGPPPPAAARRSTTCGGSASCSRASSSGSRRSSPAASAS